MGEPWGVHRIGNIYRAGVLTEMRRVHPQQRPRWVRAVPDPYPHTVPSRLRAAWWVLAGRAEALVWPQPGDLENALEEWESLRPVQSSSQSK